ncbi:MAG: hypothetical protein HC888_09935 [Candidatus Competibacteraceae bacterium]|nr:hypothetical protein [Candidatus Competibacteraceae bacterium]
MKHIKDSERGLDQYCVDNSDLTQIEPKTGWVAFDEPPLSPALSVNAAAGTAKRHGIDGCILG